MKRALAYLRVSSKEQGKSGFGLQSQQTQVNAFAEARGYGIVRVYREVASAIGTTKADRPELRFALDAARKNGCPVIVARLDRLSRDASELEDICTRSGIQIISVADWPKSDPVSLQVEKARIEMETRMLKERTANGLRQAKQQGKLFGNRKNLAEAQHKGTRANQHNASLRAKEIGAEVRKLKRAGFETGSEIADQLNARGYRTPRGQLWTDANIRRVLRRITADEKDQTESDRNNKHNPHWGLF